MKKLKYDYSKLEEFLDENYPEKEQLRGSFMALSRNYMQLSSWIVAHAAGSEWPYPAVNPEGADWSEAFMKIFEILGELPENQEDSPAPNRTMDQVADLDGPEIKAMANKYAIQEEEVRDMIRRNRMHQSFIDLEKDLPDHLSNLIELFNVYTNGKSAKYPDRKIPMVETFNKICEYFRLWGRRRPVEGGGL